MCDEGKDTGYQIFFDPSQVCGQKLRNQIVDKTLEALQLKLDEDRCLYNGILIEAGTSTTDTEQHITIKKLSNLIDEISKLEKSNMGFESDFIVGFGQMGKKLQIHCGSIILVVKSWFPAGQRLKL